MKLILLSVLFMLSRFITFVGNDNPVESAVFRRLLQNRDFSTIEALITRMDNKIQDPLERSRIDGALFAMCSDPHNASIAMDEWCAKYPNSWVAYTARGYLYVEVAWRYRGCGWASTVPEEGMRQFHAHLRMAEAALTKAFELNPATPFAATEMITVLMGSCGPRAEMEKWYHRAITAKATDSLAYESKTLYLTPKWHGSVEEVLAFADEVDRSDALPRTVAVIYGNIWLHMSHYRESALLSNPKYLSNAAQAYARFSETYPYRRTPRIFCAFFALRSGNYPLAAKQFNSVEWRSKTPDLCFWKSKAAFEADRALAFSHSPRTIDHRKLMLLILGAVAGLFYIPVIVRAIKQGRSWADTLALGAILMFFAFRLNGYLPHWGTGGFVIVHVLTAGHMIREKIQERRALSPYRGGRG